LVIFWSILLVRTALNGYPKTIDAQDILWAQDQPETFNKAHRPIKLNNKELLLKLGFRDSFRDCMSLDEFEFHFELGLHIVYDSTVTGGYTVDVTVENIHQFQNLYWCLRGKELETKDYDENSKNSTGHPEGSK